MTNKIEWNHDLDLIDISRKPPIESKIYQKRLKELLSEQEDKHTELTRKLAIKVE